MSGALCTLGYLHPDGATTLMAVMASDPPGRYSLQSSLPLASPVVKEAVASHLEKPLPARESPGECELPSCRCSDSAI